MIRIVHVISDLDTGGAEMMLVKLVGAMDRDRFSNTVISLTDRGQLGGQIEYLGVTVHSLGMKRGRPGLLALPRLIRLLRTLKPTIVQSWLYHADFLCLLAAPLAGVPSMVWNLRCSDMDFSCYPRQTRWIMRALALASSRPDAVIVNSMAGQRVHCSHGYRVRRWEVIPNGFDLTRFYPDVLARQQLCEELGVSTDAVLVGLVARVDPMKGHGIFLDAAALVAKARTAARFLLVGRDTYTLKPAIDERGLASFFYLLGERENVNRLLPGMDIACLSSISEGFPNVLGEAMACGVPCAATDVGDARSIVADTGLIVPARNPAALANAIIDLIDRGPAVREQLGRAARVRIETEYSLPRIIDRYATLYSDLSAGYEAAT